MPLRFANGSLAVLLVIALSAQTQSARAQPALTEPWPQEEEVSDMQQIGGTMTAFLFGFGTGHAIQGRWHETGWIFTLGEGIAATGMVGSVIAGIGCNWDCRPLEGVMIGSMLALTALRIWETYDAAVGPREHNARLYAKRRRALQPVLAPTRGGDGFVGGAQLRF